jgi:hypothetical protein
VDSKKKMISAHQVRAELGNVNLEDRTVEVVWSTGSKGIRSGWDGPYYEELSMDPKHIDMSRLNAGTSPVLANHNRDDLSGVIGVVEKAWLENGVGKATLRFSASDPAADQAFKKIQERVLRNVSVGYSVSQYTNVSQKGDKIQTLRATNWQPQEISIVPVGFDRLATTRTEENLNEVEVLDQETPIQETIMSENRTEETPISSPEVIDVQALKEKSAVEAQSQERARVLDITQAVRAAKLEESMALEMIRSGVSMADASKEIFKKLEEQSSATAVRSNVSVQVTRDENETRNEGIVNLMLNKVDPKKFALDENGKRFYGMSAIRIAEELNGGRFGLSDSQLATRAMSTSDLPNILANVAEKSMREAYNVQPQSYKAWTKQGQLRNYKLANRLQIGDFPSFEVVNEHGEYKEGAFSDSKEQIQLKRYGKKLQMTKEMIINDDLGALADFSSKSARAAARLGSQLVYGLLTSNPNMADGNALFSVAHANLASSSTAITVAAVAAGEQAIMTQLTLDGVDYVDIAPRFLICGPAKKLEAMQFLSTALLANQVSSINPYAGKYELVVDPRISGNQWYLVADPALIDTIEVAGLEGEEGPTCLVKPGNNPGNIEIFCDMSVGVAAMDFRGMYKNAGN